MNRAYVTTLLAAVMLCAATSATAEQCPAGRSLYQQAMAAEEAAIRLSLLQRSNAQCSNYNVLYQLGQTALRLQRFKEAARWFEQAAMSDGAAVEAVGRALLRQGQALEQSERLLEAIEVYKRAQRAQPRPQVAEHLRRLQLAKRTQGYTSAEIADALVLNRAIGVGSGVELPVNFEYNSAVLTEAGRRQAAQLGEALLDSRFADKKITLLGHTDSRGGTAFNQTLSEKRAVAVREFLRLNYPFPDGRIVTEGRGESEPLSQGENEESWSLNRRVEVLLQ